MMREWLAVAIGGLIGTILRHGTANLFSLMGGSWLLIATLAVNLSLIVGGVGG